MRKIIMIFTLSVIITLLSTTSILMAANKLPPKANSGMPFDELLTSINKNADKIATNTVSIATNSTDIAIMAASVAANASAIANNAAAIAVNLASIEALQSQINDLQSQLNNIQQSPTPEGPPESDSTEESTISGKRIYTGYAALSRSGYWPYYEFRSDWINVDFDNSNYIVITNNNYTVVKKPGSFQLHFVYNRSLSSQGGDWLAVGE